MEIFNGNPADFVDFMLRLKVKLVASGCWHHVEATPTEPLQATCPAQPVEPALTANETVQARYRFKYTQWSRDSKTWKTDDQAGMKILEENVSDSIKKNYFIDKNTLYLQVNELKTAFMPTAGTLPDATVTKWRRIIKDGYKFTENETLRSFLMQVKNYEVQMGTFNGVSEFQTLFEKIEDVTIPKDFKDLDNTQSNDPNKPLFYPFYSVYKNYTDSHVGARNEVYYKNLLDKLYTKDEDMRQKGIYPKVKIAVVSPASKESSKEAVNVLSINNSKTNNNKKNTLCTWCLTEGHTSDECRRRACGICGGNHMATKCFQRYYNRPQSTNKTWSKNQSNSNNDYNNNKKNNYSNNNNYPKNNSNKHHERNQKRKFQKREKDHESKRAKQEENKTDK